MKPIDPKQITPALLSRAVVVWTGHRRNSRPARRLELLLEEFGAHLTAELYPAVRQLDADFNASDARQWARSLTELGAAAAAEFRHHHPEVSDAAVAALTWCYQYDFT